MFIQLGKDEKIVIETKDNLHPVVLRKDNNLVIMAFENNYNSTEFYFTEAVQQIVYNWYKKQMPKTYKQREYLNRLKEALNAKIFRGQRMQILEPSMGENKKIQFIEGEEVLTGLPIEEWEEKFREKGGRLGTLFEIDIFIAYIMATEKIPPTDFTYSSSAYYNNEELLALTGSRVVAGYLFGIGNTYKLVKDTEQNRYVLYGGVQCDDGPICSIYDIGHYWDCSEYTVGLYVEDVENPV